MARSTLKTLFVSMEEGEFDDEGNPVVINIDSDAVEITQTFAEAEDAVEDVEELEEVEEGLESIVQSLEAALEQGGLDPIAAQFAHHAVGAYVERLGMEASDLMPALEAFGGDSGRVSATTVSLEGIGETLKKIWAAIKAAVEKAIKAVADFFAKIFGGINKIKTRISDLKTAVGKLGEKEAKGEKMSVPGPNSLQLGGKVDIASIKKGLGNAVKTNKGMFGGAYLGKIGPMYTKLVTEINTLKTKDEETAINESLKTLSVEEKKLYSAVEQYQGLTLPGDKAFLKTINVVRKTADSDSFDESSSFKFGPIKGANAFSGKAEIAIPSASDLSEILKDCSEIADSVSNCKTEIGKIKTAREAAIAAGKTIVDGSDRNKVGKVWAKAKSHVVLRWAQRDFTRPITQLTAYNFSLLRAELAFVDSAVKHYKDKKAATTP
jgi:hypothetical protein